MLNPYLVLDDRVLRLGSQAELLFWRSALLAQLLRQTYVGKSQIRTLKYDLYTEDGYGGCDSWTDEDADKAIARIEHVGLWRTDRIGDDADYHFSEDIFWDDEEIAGAKADDDDSKPAKPTDPELSAKRAAAGRKGAAARRENQTPPALLIASTDEGAA